MDNLLFHLQHSETAQSSVLGDLSGCVDPPLQGATRNCILGRSWKGGRKHCETLLWNSEPDKAHTGELWQDLNGCSFAAEEHGRSVNSVLSAIYLQTLWESMGLLGASLEVRFPSYLNFHPSISRLHHRSKCKNRRLLVHHVALQNYLPCSPRGPPKSPKWITHTFAL